MANDLIVIENVSTLEYSLSNEKVLLNIDHLTILIYFTTWQNISQKRETLKIILTQIKTQFIYFFNTIFSVLNSNVKIQ